MAKFPKIQESLDNYIEFAEKTKRYADVGFYTRVKDYINELEATLAKGKQEWISVDTPPDIGADVLIRIPVCSHFNVESGTYKGEGQFVGAWCKRHGKGCAYDVSHWIPALPSPPSQKENDDA